MAGSDGGSGRRSTCRWCPCPRGRCGRRDAEDVSVGGQRVGAFEVLVRESGGDTDVDGESASAGAVAPYDPLRAGAAQCGFDHLHGGLVGGVARHEGDGGTDRDPVGPGLDRLRGRGDGRSALAGRGIPQCVRPAAVGGLGGRRGGQQATDEQTRDRAERGETGWARRHMSSMGHSSHQSRATQRDRIQHRGANMSMVWTTSTPGPGVLSSPKGYRYAKTGRGSRAAGPSNRRRRGRSRRRSRRAQ